jgi:hypothetical protein
MVAPCLQLPVHMDQVKRYASCFGYLWKQSSTNKGRCVFMSQNARYSSQASVKDTSVGVLPFLWKMGRAVVTNSLSPVGRTIPATCVDLRKLPNVSCNLQCKEQLEKAWRCSSMEKAVVCDERGWAGEKGTTTASLCRLVFRVSSRCCLAINRQNQIRL